MFGGDVRSEPGDLQPGIGDRHRDDSHPGAQEPALGAGLPGLARERRVPDVEFVLQGEGITLVVDGQTDIKGGVTYSKFETAPDAPFTTFETVLPAGPKSVLAIYNEANKEDPYSACGAKLTMPTTIISQANKVIENETPVTTTGCSGVKHNKTTKLSLHQRYTKALHACRTRYKHNKHKRQACEHKARITYTAKALAACRHTHRHAGKARKTCETTAHRQYAAKVTRPQSGK